MARPGLTQHRKFRRLSRAIGGDIMARGVLELMWEPCYEAGDDYLGTAHDIEAMVRWTGEPGLLARALADAGKDDDSPGFIDEIEGKPGRYRVHDLYDHAPEYVKRRLEREIERKKRGLSITTLRAKAGKESGRKRRQTKGFTIRTHDEQVTNKREHMVESPGTNGLTPAPAPAPAPAHRREIKSVSSEPLHGSKPEPVLLTFPTVGATSQWNLTQSFVAELESGYPNLDVLENCRHARLWILAHVSRRKTAKGMPRFLVGWLNRSTDRGRGGGGSSGGKTVTERNLRGLREDLAVLDEFGQGDQTGGVDSIGDCHERALTGTEGGSGRILPYLPGRPGAVQYGDGGSGVPEP